MKNTLVRTAACCFGLLALNVALADPAIMAGRFEAGDPKVPSILGDCTNAELFYASVGPIQASDAGTYRYADASIAWNDDIAVTLYNAAFNPQNPSAGQVMTLDDDGEFTLQANTNYYLVVQPYCDNKEGVWTLTLWGPGNVSGTGVTQAPAHWFGNFDGTEPLTDTTPVDYCDPSYYQVNGPLQVDETGTYFFSPVSSSYSFQLQFAVYKGNFNPNQPAVNRVASIAFPDEVFLESGQNYYFVTQPACSPDTGDWFYVLAPPAPFEISPGLNGTWLNWATEGQGFLMEVLPDTGIIFYAEFTWDTSAPAEGAESVVGNPGNRWVIGQGPYEKGSSSVELPAYFSSGGIYNDPAHVTNTQSGTITLDFENGCLGGTRTFNFTNGPQGSVPFERLTNDNLKLCTDQTKAPGVIGEQ